MTRHSTLEPHVPSTQDLRAVPRHAAAGVHVPPPDRTDGPSVASFVTALVGLVVPLVSVVAILFGSIGVGRSARRGTRGRGLAKTGITLGVLELAVTFVVGIVLFGIWNAYGDDLREGLDGVAAVSHEYVPLAEAVGRFVDGDLVAAVDVARALGPDGLAQLARSAGELRGLAEDCRIGDADSCGALLDALPPAPDVQD